MAEVKLEKINKTYPNGFEAINNLNLKINDGEFMVLVGPSGCAKSTCLRMIAGLEDISDGTLSIGNKIVNDLSPKDRGIAMVFQNYALYPHMTVYENMAFGLKLKKIPKKEIDLRVKKAAEKLEISELLDRKPKMMSGGQRQRVAVGRAIVKKPDVFLFDEPLSNLDAKLRVSMRVKIVELHEKLKAEGQNATMIYVTHDQVEAMTMGDRICVLDKGQIMQVDTPVNLYNSPSNKFVAGFIGSPAMNILEAKLNAKGEKIFVNIGKHKLELPKDKSVNILAHHKKIENSKVWFGVRPEYIEVVPQQTTGLTGKIELVENMGSEKYYYFTMDGKRYTAKVPAESKIDYNIGDIICFNISLNKCHIFDYESGKNISLPNKH